MHRIAALISAAAIFAAQGAWAAGSSWNKIRYMGGTIQAKVNPYDYNTTLTVSPDSIVLAFSPRPTVRIKPSQVTSISYGQEALRRVSAVVALDTPGKPPALFGLLRTKDYFIGIVYQTEDGKTGAVLLETRFYLSILEDLKFVTGKPIDISK